MTEQSTALQALLAVVRSGDYLILDTETTGVDRIAEPVQLAIINAGGEVLINTLIKPYHSIPQEAIDIHGITNTQVEDAPTWEVVAPYVVDLLTGRDVIVFNAVFDRKMMHRAAEFWGMEPVAWKEISRFHCAMLGYAEVYGEVNPRYGDFKWQSLSKAARAYGIDVVKAHGAVDDCRTTLAVVRAMAGLPLP